MRVRARRPRCPEPRPRRASAWLALGALLAALALQGQHRASAAPCGEVVRVVEQSAATSLALSHDAERCPICRAIAKTRLALRASRSAASESTDGAARRLGPPGAGADHAEPELGSARSRAPPFRFLAQSA